MHFWCANVARQDFLVKMPQCIRMKFNKIPIIFLSIRYLYTKVTKLLDIIVCGGIIELAADIFLRKCYKAVIFCCDNVAFFAHKEDLETLLIGIENRCKFLYDTMSL